MTIEDLFICCDSAGERQKRKLPVSWFSTSPHGNVHTNDQMTHSTDGRWGMLQSRLPSKEVSAKFQPKRRLPIGGAQGRKSMCRYVHTA